jgi:hypothetical protein
MGHSLGLPSLPPDSALLEEADLFGEARDGRPRDAGLFRDLPQAGFRVLQEHLAELALAGVL